MARAKPVLTLSSGETQPSFVPHLLQNAMPSSTALPQFGHVLPAGASGSFVPHLLQNAMSSLTMFPQFGQVF